MPDFKKKTKALKNGIEEKTCNVAQKLSQQKPQNQLNSYSLNSLMELQHNRQCSSKTLRPFNWQRRTNNGLMMPCLSIFLKMQCLR
jgi:hypothetical protein